MDDRTKDRIRELLEAGCLRRAIADELGVSPLDRHPVGASSRLS
jgi:hypothetical protein